MKQATCALIFLIGLGSIRLYAANKFWVATAAGNWNNTANWSTTSGGAGGAAIPTGADAVVFDNGGLGACTINVGVTITSLAINAGFSGTITQGINTVTTTGAATFGSGTWIGGSGAMSIGGVATLSGTAFTFPSVISVSGGWTYTAGTLNTTLNNSTVLFNNSMVITGSVTLDNVQFDDPGTFICTYTLAGGTTLAVTGNMSMSGTGAEVLNSGTISLQGNLNLTNTSTGGTGSTVIAFVGTTNQTINSGLTIDQSSLPSVNINKASGTLIFPAILSMGGSSWTYTKGTLDVTTNNSTVVFDGFTTTITGNHTLNNIQFDDPSPFIFIWTFTTGTTVTVTGNMAMSGSGAMILNGGTINLNGNLNLTNTSIGGGGSTVIAFVSPVNQTITSALAIDQCSLPSVNINKPAGTLLLPVILSVAGTTWTYTTGTLDVTTNNSTVVFDGIGTTITGNHTLKNVDFDDFTTFINTYTIDPATTLTISGNMAMSGNGALFFNTGIIDLFGNLDLTNTGLYGGGSTVVTFLASTNQAITTTVPVINESTIPSVNINKPSGTLTFPSLITMAGTSWTYTTGMLDVTTNNSTVVFEGLNTAFTGNHSLNNIDFDNTTSFTCTYIVNTGTTVTALGNMAISGNSIILFANGTINLNGNLNLSSTSPGDGGSTVINFMGTGNQAINSSLPVNECAIPSVSINKPSGTLTLCSLITNNGNSWTWTSGTVDAGTNASTMWFIGAETISSNGMSFYNINVNKNTNSLGNNLSALNNITISGSGILAPGANSISLLGNWTDRATAGFTEATSTVNFNGASVQTITVTGGGLENFNNLTVNNSGAGIQLVNNVTVGKNLTMTQGNIDLNGKTLVLGLSVANNGTLVYTTGTIINAGAFTRWLKNAAIPAGSVNGLFPVGTVTDYRPFNVSAPTTGPTTGGTITVVYTDAATYTDVSFPDGAFTVQRRKDLNWTLSTANGITGGSYNLTLAGTNFGLIAALTDLRMTLAGSVIGTAGINAGTTANPQVNRTGITQANLNNTFFLGTVNPGMTTLPVSLTSFAAMASNGKVVLNWTTDQETNSAYYTIQRSSVGTGWDSVARIAAAGTSNWTISYKAYDDHPLAGVSQYRLRMTDRDGQVSYSGIQVVNFSNSTATILLYPNPASDNLYVRFGHKGKYQATLLNELGQALSSVGTSNADNLLLPVSAMRSGTYFVRITGEGQEVRKIIIKR